MADTYAMIRPMPPRTKRAHFEPAWRGDRPLAILATGRKRVGPGGVRAIDCNFQLSAEGTAWTGHWGIPKKDNWKYIYDPRLRRVRAMTRAELNRPMILWTDEQIMLWRRGRTKNSARPHTYREMAALAVHHGVVICAELKSPRFADPVVAMRIVHDALSEGHPPWFMSLINMKNCRGKCEAIVNAGGQFAVIFGRFRIMARRAPADWSQWSPKPTRLWGPAKWPM